MSDAPAGDPGTATTHVVLGAGPVGQAVVAALGRRGVRPTVVTRRGTSIPGATAVAADVADPASAKEALATADVVYQCAQPAYHRWPQEFPGLQRSILDAAGAAGAVLVAAENLYGYGPVVGPIHEGLPLAATTRKGRVRAAMWDELEEAHQAGRARTVAARASDFYGPGVADSMLGERFFGGLLRGKGGEAIGDVDRLHSVTYVPDLAEAMVVLGADEGAWGRAWHVPTAPARTMRELVALAAGIAGVAAAPKVVPVPLLRVAGLFVPAIRETLELLYEFREDFVVDDSDYRERYAVDATPLETGLAETIAWFRAHAAAR